MLLGELCYDKRVFLCRVFIYCITDTEAGSCRGAVGALVEGQCFGSGIDNEILGIFANHRA